MATRVAWSIQDFRIKTFQNPCYVYVFLKASTNIGFEILWNGWFHNTTTLIHEVAEIPPWMF